MYKFGLTEIVTVPASELQDDLNRLNGWLEGGYHGEMGFLARNPERRSDPRKIMPSCKTVIVAAMRYDSMPSRHAITKLQAPNHKHIPDSKLQIPKYLQHKDYHLVMMEKLEMLVSELKKEHPNAEFKCYVDTGPVLEKAWGARAGLGFIGKNTLLISPEHGSQIALGVVLSSIACHCERSEAISGIQSDSGDCFVAGVYPERTIVSRRAPRNDNSACGSCRKCIDACPTGALVKPYTLDARKCISYKFFIKKTEGGCDICQNACPFNK